MFCLFMFRFLVKRIKNFRMMIFEISGFYCLRSIHNTRNYLRIENGMNNKCCFIGEDPETRRLRTVKNIADLRQNLEETMSSLRGTQISHRFSFFFSNSTCFKSNDGTIVIRHSSNNAGKNYLSYSSPFIKCISHDNQLMIFLKMKILQGSCPPLLQCSFPSNLK